MLGDNLLPVHNAPCTARICHIKHKHFLDPGPPHLTETGVVDSAPQTVAEGSADVCNYLTNLNNSARGGKHGANEPLVTMTARFVALEKFASTSSQTQLTVIDTPGKRATAAINALITLLAFVLYSANKGFDGIWAGGCNIVGVKIPIVYIRINYHNWSSTHAGPNEAGAQFLQQDVEDVLSNIDAMIYVLDYTKIGVLLCHLPYWDPLSPSGTVLDSGHPKPCCMHAPASGHRMTSTAHKMLNNSGCHVPS